jgi:hypothetical protein
VEINSPTPRPTQVLSNANPTTEPSRNGMVLRNPVLCPMAIMVIFAGPGDPVIAITNIKNGITFTFIPSFFLVYKISEICSLLQQCS